MNEKLQEFAKVYNDLKNFPTNVDVAYHFGINERTVRKRARRAREEGIELIKRGKVPLTEEETIFRENYTNNDKKKRTTVDRRPWQT